MKRTILISFLLVVISSTGFSQIIREKQAVLQKLNKLGAISEPIQHPDVNEKEAGLENLYFFDINDEKFNTYWFFNTNCLLSL